MKRISCILLTAILSFFSVNIDIYAQAVSGELGNVAVIKKGLRNRRISSTDVNGNNGDWVDSIKPGDKWSVDIAGAGVINHIWFTISPMNIQRNDLIFRIYWDGKSYPSVESPLAAFFGNGWDEYYEYASLPLAVGPQAGTGLVSYFQMPFANGARIEIENQSDETISRLYFSIDYVSVNELPSDLGRFHAWYNHELTDALPEGETEWGLVGPQANNIDGADNYLFADIKGEGQFIGINYYVHCPTPMWYGEGDDMFFIDGEKIPSLVGTGTEDFFNTSWCPKTIFSHPYYGYARVNNDIGWLGRTHVYRFFIADPIYFEKSLKGTIEHGHNNNLTLDIGSVAYWYQTEASMLPPAPSKEERTPKAFIRDQDMHRWRHEWRKNHENGSKLWGNEVNN